MRKMLPRRLIDWIKDASKLLIHNEATNTTELGGNVEIDGNLKVNGHAMLDLTGLVVDTLPATGYDGQIIVKRNYSVTQITKQSDLVLGEKYKVSLPVGANVGNPTTGIGYGHFIEGPITNLITEQELYNRGTLGENVLGFGDSLGVEQFIALVETGTAQIGLKSPTTSPVTFDIVYRGVKSGIDIPDNAKIFEYMTKESILGYDLYCFKNGEWHRVDLDD